MNALLAEKQTAPRVAGGQRGFTLVELMVTVGIALFLLGGLVTIVQNVRQANLIQQQFAQLQDAERFAMTVISDIVEAGGYYPYAAAAIPSTVFLASGPMVAGQAFYGQHPGGVGPDTLTVRLQTVGGDGVIECDGSTNNAAPGTNPTVYTNVFTMNAATGQLTCQLNGGPVVPLVNNLQNIVIYYGVNRNAPTINYNIDTYLTADQMDAALPAGGDWMNISSVRVVLTFTNPLAGVPGQPATIVFERVVAVMARAGVHS
jgi:type IV pilus assembly protein PilW